MEVKNKNISSDISPASSHNLWIRNIFGTAYCSRYEANVICAISQSQMVITGEYYTEIPFNETHVWPLRAQGRIFEQNFFLLLMFTSGYVKGFGLLANKVTGTQYIPYWYGLIFSDLVVTISLWIKMLYSPPKEKSTRFAPTQIARFIGPTWGPPGSCRPQVGPMLAP